MNLLSPLIRLISRGSATVLMFHRVPKVSASMVPSEHDLEQFLRLIDIISANFRILPLDHVVKGLRRENLPERAACLTFDDGYPDWIAGVAPELLKRNLHATFFITTGQFNGLTLWHERIREAVGQANCNIELPSFSPNALPVNSLSQKQRTCELLENNLKYRSLSERHHLIEMLEAHSGSQTAAIPKMLEQDVRDLHNMGFGIGAHTISHPILSQCDDATARNEIAGCREQLSNIISAPVSHFAYPNGGQNDFSDAHVRMVQDAGYACAFTTKSGVIRNGASLYQLPRFTPWGPSESKILIQLARNIAYS